MLLERIKEFKTDRHYGLVLIPHPDPGPAAKSSMGGSAAAAAGWATAHHPMRLPICSER